MISLAEYSSFTELESLREEWDRCVLECNSSVYMTFDWCKTWWDFYGGKKDLSIQLFFSGNKLVGVLPLYIEKIYFGSISLKVGKLIGANIPPKVFDPPLQNEYKSLIINQTLQSILPQKADVVSFGPVSEFYYQDNIISDININHNASPVIQSNYEPYSYFKLPQNFEEYLECINHAEKKDYKYNFKRLNRDYKISVEISKKFDEADFSKFLEMHYLQWSKQGKLGHFNSWPDGKAFNIALAKKQSELGRYMLLRIVMNDEVIVYDYGYRLGDRFYGQLSARSVQPEIQKYSLGTLGMVSLVKILIDEKINFMEAGLGYYDYKLKLGAKPEKTFIYRFIADKKSSLIKYHLLEMEKKIGGLMFHKIWYRRIQPNLPAPLKTPISSRSIKLDY